MISTEPQWRQSPNLKSLCFQELVQFSYHYLILRNISLPILSIIFLFLSMILSIETMSDHDIYTGFTCLMGLLVCHDYDV